MNRNHEVSDWIAAAAALRARISDLFGLGPAEHVVLVPGILIGLQVLLHSLNIRRVGLSDQEYYGQAHFPAFDVRASGLDELLTSAARERPDAVLTSLVTWRGEELPVAQLFCRLRSGLGEKVPLLIADCTHAGAVGFPNLDRLNADIVCGDTGKWIFPADWESKIAFFWFRTPLLATTARRAFEPFFLAAGERDALLRARWLDPAEVAAVECWYRRRHLDLKALRRRHRANLALAARLADHYGVAITEGNCILRLGAGTTPDTLLKKLDRAGLTWRMPDGEIRILCRADVLR